MADKPVCKIPDCCKAAIKRGWCSTHYQRWYKHGDPLVLKLPHGQARQFYENVVLTYEGDECLIWPFSRSSNGYGHMLYGEEVQTVSRLVCIEVHGTPPNPKDDAAHSCGNGHLGCVAKRHMSWKTRSENQMDRVEHGTSNRGERCGSAKLTENDVHRIRDLRGILPVKEIAKMFGIAQQTVYGIYNGDRWRWLA